MCQCQNDSERTVQQCADRFMGDVLQGMAEMTFATKERWEGQVEQMKADGAWPEGAATGQGRAGTRVGAAAR